MVAYSFRASVCAVFIAILLAIAGSAKAAVVIPSDFCGGEVYWSDSSGQLQSDLDYWLEGGGAGVAAGPNLQRMASASVGPGVIRVGAFSDNGTAAAVAVMNEGLRLPFLEPPEQVRVYVEMDGVIGVGGDAAEAYIALNPFSDALLTPDSVVSPGMWHPDSTSYVASGVMSNVDGEWPLDAVLVSGIPGVAGNVDFNSSGTWRIHDHRISFLLNYQPDYDGYYFSLVAQARSDVQDGFARADFGNTFQIVDVTLPEGDPIPGEVWFDSGYRLDAMAVPEHPGTVTMLLGLGAFGALGRRFARAGSSAAAQNRRLE